MSSIRQQGRRLVAVEGQAIRADLGELTRGAEAAQMQGRIGPGQDQDRGGRRKVLDQEVDLLVARAGPDEVVVVERQQDGDGASASALTISGSRPFVMSARC